MALKSNSLGWDTFIKRRPPAADGATGPGYWPAAFFTTQVKFFLKQINLSFIWDKCCHLMMCLHLIETACVARFKAYAVLLFKPTDQNTYETKIRQVVFSIETDFEHSILRHQGQMYNEAN